MKKIKWIKTGLFLSLLATLVYPVQAQKLGQVITQSRELASFERIVIKGSIDVYISQGESQSV